MNLPTEQQCIDYFQQYKVPQNIFQHCLKVREVAVFLAKRLQEAGVEINLEAVNCLALLHDLFKVVSLSSLGHPKYHQINPSEEEISMWKQLREKYSGMYEGEVAYLFFKDDYPEMAAALRNIGNPKHQGWKWEELVVHYADWRSFQNKIVNLKERLDYLKDVYMRDAEAWEEDEKRMLFFENKIMREINLNPNQLPKQIDDFNCEQSVILEGKDGQ